MALVLRKADSINLEPLDVGGGKFHIEDVIARPEGAPVTGGVFEIWNSQPVDFDYDDDCAVCFVLEGEIELVEEGESHQFVPGDVLYVPQQAGLVVSWHTPSYAKVAFVTYPHWR